MSKKIWLICSGFFLLALLYRGWFVSLLPLAAGDWGIKFPGALEQYSFYPQAWDAHFGNGLGGNSVFLLGLDTYFSGVVTFLFRYLSFSWIYIERLLWVVPFILLTSAGSALLFRYLFASFLHALLSVLIYGFNTYIIMITSGGQMGVVLGYAAAPLVMYGFIRALQEKSGQMRSVCVVATGIFVSLQFAFDLRLTYITLVAMAAWVIMEAVSRKNGKVFVYAVLPVIIAGLLHTFWLVPFVLIRQNPLASLGEEFINTGMVRFLSFAPFEHTLSFLQPNWPENIFGKIHFLPPEFLFIPIVAFTSLLFVHQTQLSIVQKKTILFFSLLGLVGVFLSKGTNPPMGDFYIWLFDTIPGFIMFRDSTKFYLLIALSYSVLIPFSLLQIGNWIGKKTGGKHKQASTVAVTVIFVLMWFFIHREGIAGQIGGTFSPRSVPQEYARLQEYFAANDSFSRVLWVPRRHRYGYVADTLPGLTLETLRVASAAAFPSWLTEDKNKQQLARFSVSHIIVPTDPMGELFVAGERYDEAARQALVAALDKDASLERLDILDIAVYKMPFTYGHAFFVENPLVSIDIRKINATHYQITLPPVSYEREIIFAETFDPHWTLTFGDNVVTPTRTDDGLQLYQIPSSSVEIVADIRYGLQRFVDYGLMVSGGVSAVILVYLAYATITLWKKRHVS